MNKNYTVWRIRNGDLMYNRYMVEIRFIARYVLSPIWSIASTKISPLLYGKFSYHPIVFYTKFYSEDVQPDLHDYLDNFHSNKMGWQTIIVILNVESAMREHTFKNEMLCLLDSGSMEPGSFISKVKIHNNGFDIWSRTPRPYKHIDIKMLEYMNIVRMREELEKYD